LQRRLAAILAADVVGYSKLMGADETGTLSALTALRTGFIEPLIAEHHGRIVKLMGDGFLVEFASVVDAVQCAIAWQTGLATRNDPLPLSFRIGVNLGDIILEDGDIYGDGVNIAARLETQADTGGICISSIAHEGLGNRIDATFEDLGERTLKNIDRPMRIWRWSPQSDSQAPMSDVTMSLPDQPSIAVLPFTNMSGDTDQEYFSDGVAEDIITELSRFSELFVIARNSSFVFKGQAVDIKDAARKLGVQYMVEGSVRKAGSRVRVTAQLIDAVTGAHLWADRYDRQLEDIFEVQDDVVRAIVAVLPGRIAEAGAEWSRRKPTENLSAFDHLLRGNHALARRGDSIKKAIEFYRRAIELDPECAAAYAGIAIAEGMSVWDLSTYDDSPLDRAYEHGKRALELDGSDYRSHAAFGEATRQMGQHSVARQHLERAMALNPNSTQVLGYWAMLLAYTGDKEGAVETYHRAIRLDPFSGEYVRKEILAETYYMMRRYEDSIEALKSMLKLPIFYVHQQIAIAYAQLGDMAACEKHMALYRAALPETYDEKLLFESHLRLCAHEEDAEHWRQGYRLSGMDV
jgi:TolB-like protein